MMHNSPGRQPVASCNSIIARTVGDRWGNVRLNGGIVNATNLGGLAGRRFAASKAIDKIEGRVNRRGNSPSVTAHLNIRTSTATC